MKHRLVVAFVLCLLPGLALLGGCGEPPTPTPLPTATPTPTHTPTPAPTPSPTPLPLADWVKEGEERVAVSDYAGAEAAFRRVLDADADYASAHTGLAWTYLWQSGREDDALEAAHRAVELAPEDAAAHAVLAHVLSEQLRGEEAVETAEKAAELDPKSAPAQAALSSAYLLERRFDEALEAAESALALDPGLAVSYWQLGRVYRDTADLGRARAACERAIDLQPQFVPWQAALADLWDLMDRDEEAVAGFQAALEAAPDDVYLLVSLAYALADLGRYAEAEEPLERAASLAPDSPEPIVARGYWHLSQDQPDEALDQFEQALEKAPDDYWAERAVADVHLDESDCDAAARQAERLSELQPRSADGRVYLGFAKLCDGDPAKALDSLRKAVELDPYDWTAHLGLARAYGLQDRPEEASAAQVDALRLAPAAGPVHVDLAWSLMSQGEPDRARAEFETALRQDPTLTQAHIGLAVVLLDDNRPAEAQAHAEAVLALQPQDEEARGFLGAALYRQGKLDQAVEVLESLVEDKPENGLARHHLGLAYCRLGRYADAKKELETYQALEPNAPGQNLVGVLVSALGEGYTLKEAKALEDLKEGLEAYIDAEFTLTVAELPGRGRTLRLSLPKGEDAEQGDLVMDMVYSVGGAATLLPRIDPPVDGGLTVQILDQGKTPYGASIDLASVRLLADGLDTGVGLRTHLAITRTLDAEGAWLEALEAGVAEVRGIEDAPALATQPITPGSLDLYTSGSVTAAAQQASQASAALLEMLGVLAPGERLDPVLEALYGAAPAAFYDPAGGVLYLAAGTEQSNWDQVAVAHEVAHAVQPALGSEPANADQRRAMAALVEGDAALVMLLYADETVRVVEPSRAYVQVGGIDFETFRESRGFLRALHSFPYEAGVSFVYELYDGEWQAVDEAYAEPPLSTEQVLHPDRYRSGEEPVAVTLPDLEKALGGGWNEVESDVLGELGLGAALGHFLAPGAVAPAVEGWGGDRYSLLRQGAAGPHLLVVQTAWDDADEAEQFWQMVRVYMAHRPGYAEQVKELVGELTGRWWAGETGVAYAQQEGKGVTLILAPDDETAETALAALAE